MLISIPAIYLALPAGGIVAFLPMILIFVIFYMLIMMPQQKRQKKLQAMISSLKNGDRVMTSGGIRGTVVSVKDDAIQLRVAPDNLRIEVARGAVVSMLDESSS